MIPDFSSGRSVLTSAVLIWLCIGYAASTADAEPAIGQFELKTLESSPGAIEFQSQNAWSWGHPARRVASDDTGRLVFDENAVIRQRHALEIEAGFTSSVKMRAGIEFEKERIEEPETLAQANSFDELKLTEIGLEIIAVLAQRHGDGAGLGLVMEFERPIDDEEPDTLVFGTIVEFRSGRWFAAAVPMAVRTLGGRTEEGDPIDDKWDFAYAAQLTYSISARWSLAIEGYGTVERLDDTGHPSESAQLFSDFDQHRAGVVVYRAYEFGCAQCRRSTPAALPLSGSSGTEDEIGLTIGLGLLAGLNDHTPDHTLKLSIEVDF